jgi:hypothetical protein
VSRQPRIPGTTTKAWRCDVATGGDPTGALVRAIEEFRAIRRGHIWRLDISHDDGCAALAGRGMGACSCEVVRLEGRRAA